MIDNYKALTLGRFMKIDAILRSGEDEVQQQVEIIAVLADMDADDVLQLPLGDYAKYAKQTAFLRVPCKPTEITDGYRWRDLLPVADFRKINTAQYIDFQTFAKDFPATLPEILSVFMVPEGKAYNDGYDPAAVQQQVREMPLADALGLAAFFFGKFSALIVDSLTSWGAEMRKADPQKKKELTKKIAEVQALLQSAGVGLPMLTE